MKKQNFLKENDKKLDSMTLNVTSAKLCADNIEDKTEKSKALMVPVWKFTIEEELIWADGRMGESSYSYQLNAIDGGTMPP